MAQRTIIRPGVPAVEEPPRAAGPRLVTVLLVIIATILVVLFLRLTTVVMVPLVASVLVALAVMPVRDWVEDRVPRKLSWLGVAVAMTLILLLIAGFFGALWLAAMQVVAQFPGGADRQVEPMPQPEDAFGPQAGISLGPPGSAGDPPGIEAAPVDTGGTGNMLSDLLPESLAGLSERFGDALLSVLSSVAAAVLNSAVELVSALAMIFFLTLLVLVESRDWRQKIAAITERRNEWRLTESAEVIAQKLRAWLVIRAVLGMMTAALYGAWLWLFDVGLLIVWMILTFLLNFIPTVGSIIAGLLPVVYALVTQDFTTALWVGIGILVIEQVMGNFVDPKVSGNRIAVSPLVVLVALLVWSWVWGIPGALLAGPVTVSLIVLGSYVPVLRPWALLLSDRTDMEGLRRATEPE